MAQADLLVDLLETATRCDQPAFRKVAEGLIRKEKQKGQKGHQLLAKRLQATGKKDATTPLAHAIPYGLAVTLGVTQGIPIPIHEQLRARLQLQVAVDAVERTPQW